jgi:hypothetical protein
VLSLAPTGTVPTAVFFRAGFIDVQSATTEFAAVQGSDSPFALGVVIHLHEAKTLGPSGVAVGYHVHTRNRAVRLKERSYFVFGGSEAEVSYENILHVIFLLKLAEQRIEGTG